MSGKPSLFFTRGATLVELVVAIVIIGVALAGVLTVFIRNTRASADPLIWHQATAIAEAYLEEALTKNFTDPDGTNVGETRATYDDVLDYNFTDVGARSQDGNLINGLGNYTVKVEAATSALNGVATAILVTVTVTPAVAGASVIVISGYRTNDGT